MTSRNDKIPEGHTKLTLIFCLIKSENEDVEKMRLSIFYRLITLLNRIIVLLNTIMAD